MQRIGAARALSRMQSVPHVAAAGWYRRAFSQWGKGIPVYMPALSPTMTSGKLARWAIAEGDAIKSGDVIAEVETDKATVDFQFQDDAYLAKILVPAGAEDVAVGAPLALVVDSAADVAAVRAGTYSTTAAAPAAPAPAAAAPAAVAPAPAAPVHAASSGAAATDAALTLPASAAFPSARLLMAAHAIDPAGIAGSGKGGRITKGDVLGFIAAAIGRAPTRAAPVVAAAAASAPAVTATAPPPRAAPPAAAAAQRPPGLGGSFTDTKPSSVRKVIAARLTESKAKVPHAYSVMECRIDALLALRATLKSAGVAVSVNDMVIKAAAKALRDVPEANCFYDAKSGTIKPNATVDVSVAVATDGGLITPIVKGADGKGLSAIAADVKDLAGRARTGKLKPEEFQGGSFTISNLGMFGIGEFQAVINPPQAAILAIGGGIPTAVLPRFGEPGSDATGPVTPVLATVMSVTLSADARVVDAAVAASYLQAFRHYVEQPTLLVT